MNLVIDASELFALARSCDAAGRLVDDELDAAMLRSVIQVERDAKSIVESEAKDTGNLMRSMTHEVVASGAGVLGRVGTNAPYGKIVHDGRTPGKMPPQGALLGWMRRHGIPAEREFVVRRAINRRKGKPIKFLDRALDKNRAKIEREFALILPKVVKTLGGR